MKYQELVEFLESVDVDRSRLIFEDELTGLYNRRFLLSYLENKVRWDYLQSEPLSLLMMDVDHFKRINDTHGHEIGDQVLIWVAQLLKEVSGESGLPIRYAGDELMILVPGAGKEKALDVAERLVSEVRDRPSPLDPLRSKIAAVTLSVGIACAPDDAQRGKDLIQKADAALYYAKRSGRDQFTDAAQTAHENVFAKTSLFQLERAAIVGREAQLKQVKKSLQEFTRGKSQFLLVEGGEGMGKSDFLKTLSGSLEGSSIRPIEVKGVFQEGFRPYYMTTSILARIMNQRPDKGAAVLDELSPAELDCLSSLLPQLTQAEQADPEEDAASQRARLFATLVQLIPKLVDSHPLLLLIDDLDLADEATLLVFRQIMVRQELAVFVCGTSKPIEAEGVEGLHVPLRKFWINHCDELNIGRICLTPLTADEIGQHFESIFPKMRIPEDLKTHLAELTQGKPLFVSEIQHKLVHDRKIVLRNQAWVIETLEEDYLPKSLEEIVKQQIARLDEESRQLLEHVSTFGEKVSLSMLTGSSQLAESKVLEFIDQAVRYGLISSEYEMNDETIRFLSRSVMGVAYSSIEEDRRKELHERIGSYQESLHPQNLLPSIATLAYHFQLSANREKASHYRKLTEAHNSRVFNSGEAINYTGEKAPPSLKLRILDSLDRRAVDHVPMILQALIAGVGETAVNSPNLKAIDSYVKALKEGIDRVLADNPHFIITYVGKMFAVNGEPVDSTSYTGTVSEFIAVLRRLSLRGVGFTPGVTEKELAAMLETMRRATDKGIDWSIWHRFAAENSPLHVEFKQERRATTGMTSSEGALAVATSAGDIGLTDVKAEQTEPLKVQKDEKGNRGSPLREKAGERSAELRIDSPPLELTDGFLQSTAEQLSDLFLQGDLEQAERIVAQLFRKVGRENPDVGTKVVDICGLLLSDIAVVSQPSFAKVLTDPLLQILMRRQELTLLGKVEHLLWRTAGNLVQFGDYGGAGRILMCLRRRADQAETRTTEGSTDRLQRLDPMMQSVLLQDLKSPEPARVQETTLLLAGLGRTAVSFLVDVIKQDEDPRVQQIACHLLGELGEEGSHSLKREIVFGAMAEQRVRILNVIDAVTEDVKIELAHAIQDHNPAVRQAAFSLAERLKNPPVTLLVNYAKHPDLALAIPAIHSLAEIKPSGLVKVLDALLESAKEEQRLIACCQTLGRIGDPAGIDPLVRILSAGRLLKARRRSSALRRAAAFALAEIPNPRASEILLHYSEDPDPAIRQLAQQVVDRQAGIKLHSARERRRYKRHSVSIPCSVEWSHHKITGTVINVSAGGALVGNVDAIPPRDSTVSLALHSDAASVELECTLSSRIVHGDLRPKPHGGAIFGVRFEEAPDEVKRKLNPVFSFFRGEH